MNITTPAELQKALDLAARERVLFNSLTAQADAAALAARAPHEAKLKTAEANEKALLASAASYCKKHRAELLKAGEKSAEIGSHAIEWRDNGGAVVFAKKRSAEKILALMLKRRALARLFVRNKPSIDKEAIAARWKRWGSVLKTLGIRYEHSETFAITLGEVTEGPPTRIKPESMEGVES